MSVKESTTMALTEQSAAAAARTLSKGVKAAVLAAAAVVLWQIPANGACPGNLRDRVDVATNPAGNDYDVYFTDDDATSADFFSALNAGFVRDSLTANHNVLVNPPYSFRNPNFSETPNDTCIFNSQNLAAAPADRITVDAPGMMNRTEPFTRAVLGHELFHHVENGYIDINNWPSWGGWTIEATARAMEDKGFNDNDSMPANTLYLGEINNYLDDPNRTLLDISYTAALFWTYLTEQLGTSMAEPGRGVEVVRDFWERAAGNDPDSVSFLRESIESFAPGRTLEDLFLDFAVANFTHSLNLSALPAAQARRYQYVDESAAGGGTMYNNVPVTAVPSASLNSILDSSVVRWGARYIDATVTSRGCQAVGVWGKARDNRTLAWGAVAIRGGNRVAAVQRSTGNSFYGAWLDNSVDPIDRLGLVAAGLNEGADFDFAVGNGEVSGSVVVPSMTRVAFVGSRGAPKRFQVRLLLRGPAVLTPSGVGRPSVRGLDSAVFQVELVSAGTGARYPATVLTSRYVSGEYWLAVQAPVIPNPMDGDLYHLEASVGGCQAGLRSRNAVLYADVHLNQMLVLDRSFSMHDPQPAEDSKIEAAKNAARLYVDATPDNDKIGLVTFNGNDSECDDDAQLVRDMVPAAPNRPDLINAINGVVEEGWTSIGDGLKRGAERLRAAVTTPEDVNVMVLLSDGMENEEEFWAEGNPKCGSPPVRDSFVGSGANAGIRVDTVAFGPDANRELLQKIATETLGIFFDVSADPPASGAAPAAARSFGAPALGSLEVPNRLANVYQSIEEDTHGLDRLHFRSDRVGTGTSRFIIPVEERSGGGVQDAVFAFNWHLASAGAQVQLTDPSGARVRPGSPGWTIFEDPTHKTYRFHGLLPPGSYAVTATASGEAQMITMLSGSVVRGVDLRVTLSQVLGPAPRSCELAGLYDYLRGLPVEIGVSLIDSQGGVPGVLVEALIESSDGAVNQLSLYDDGLHDDGAAGDGLYASAYTRTPFYSRGGAPDFPPDPSRRSSGGYTVSIRASGVSNDGKPFERFALRGFHVYEFPEDFGCNPDRDRDGLPDRWELLYGLNSADPADASFDYDLDGLSNLEEFQQGTLPFNADTDRGGEADGSEVTAGRDPLYDKDDSLPAIADYGVVTQRIDIPVHEPKPETNILHFPVNPAYRFLEIWRTDPDGKVLKLLTRVDLSTEKSGIYYDKGLVNDAVYLYYLVAEGESGARTAPTEPFQATPKADPLPPKGWIVLNQGDVFTASRDVELRLDTSDDAVEVLISQDPTFDGAAPRPVAPSINYTVAQPASGTGVATVYAKFRDAAGNESIVYHDSIHLDVNDDSDGDGLPDSWEQSRFGDLTRSGSEDEDGDGFSNKDELRNGTDPRDPQSPRTKP
jgi:hypothetical protein